VPENPAIRNLKSIVAVCEDASEDVTAKKMAEVLYEAVEENNGKILDDPTDYGLIDG